jgi:lysophospholipase L1-like esterase
LRNELNQQPANIWALLDAESLLRETNHFENPFCRGATVINRLSILTENARKQTRFSRTRFLCNFLPTRRFAFSPLALALAGFFISAISMPMSAAAQDAAVAPKKSAAEIGDVFLAAKRVCFLGDSITYHGGFIATLESIIVANGKRAPELINIGLSSETCSGDSEPIHPFPRPNVHERFARVIAKAKPDLLVVNYGINDGIYHPFSDDRFKRYKDGVNKIIQQANDSGIKVILVTPPPFDAQALANTGKLAPKDAKEFSWKTPYENYDTEVIQPYAQWILEQSEHVVACIDIHSKVTADLVSLREDDPKFRYAHDGVHLDKKGHRTLGKTIAASMGLDPENLLDSNLTSLIQQRQTILRDHWLTKIGHLRPGIKEGLSEADAAEAVAELNEKIAAAMKAAD